jgi:polysaccharide pyruvyl transferase WcaK-like protein/SAM-dependent methyltransferase
MKAHLLFNGLGAGNIGDEAMFAGFLNTIYPRIDMTIEVFDKNAPVVETLPPEHSYMSHNDSKACLKAALDSEVVLIVGNTPVMEDWGLEWPMLFHARHIDELKRYGKTIYALGVGVDFLHSKEGRKIFSNSHFLIDGWTVRSDSCREALVDLGVSEDRIRVAADLAWVFQPKIEGQMWAEDFLSKSGIDLTRPILGINVVNERWAGVTNVKKEIAFALDKVLREVGAQLVFLCNETRNGEYFDLEASRQVAGFLESERVFIISIYCTPAQMVGLISFCTLTISQRYHFTILSVLAETPVLSFARGQRLISLLKEFRETPLENMENVEGMRLYDKVMKSLSKKDEIVRKQQFVRSLLGPRAYKNVFYLSDTEHFGKRSVFRLAKVDELELPQYKVFMNNLNYMAAQLNLRQFNNWSKVWEYPWLWFNGLWRVDCSYSSLLDLGSELSPMPWFLASLGMKVTLVESDPRYVPRWEHICRQSGLSVDWHIVSNEKLPFRDESFDVVTSFSVIEHQKDKIMAVNEVLRILKRSGLFAISFDICEPEMGMTFPEWNGKALTMVEFEELIWDHPGFDTSGNRPKWNVEDIPEFLEWHLQSASYHNYVVGAGILTKKK